MGDDLRQELLASQLVTAFATAWRAEQLPLWTRPVRVLVTSNASGMIDVVAEAISVHQAKKATGVLFFCCV